MRLDFIIAGFSKCGTTALFSMLAKHESLFLPSRFKEPRFFNRENYEIYWNLYANLFYTAKANTLIGEGSISYSESEFALLSAKRIRKHFPKIKIIFIARDPVTRLESSYREMHNSGSDWGIRCPGSIEKALISMPNMLNDTKYWEILTIYESYFPKEQLLVIFQEELKQNPKMVLEHCCQFLDISSQDLDTMLIKDKNQGEAKYYDTIEFREARQSIEFSRAVSKINVSVQNQFLPGLNMRQVFGKKGINWSEGAKKQVVESLGQQPFTFLSKYGKAPLLWNKYLQFID